MAKKPENQLTDWEKFINRHEIASSVPPLIARSWERCWPRISPYSWINLQQLNETALLDIQVVNFNLLSIARPIMEDTYQYIEDSSSAILLVNQAGYVLDLVGEANILAYLQQISIMRGTLLSEMEMGTNAFGVALTERIPAQVRGPQHYRQQFHQISEAATPIFDLTGKALGALGIINFDRDSHPHSLGLTVASARAIEGQRETDQLMSEQNSQLASLNAILNTISEAILVWNRDGILIHANPAATQLLRLNLDGIKGHPIEEKIELPGFITQAVDIGKDLTDVEANLTIEGLALDCILTLRFVRDASGSQAVVAILREAKEIRQLIQRQTGSQAFYTMQDLVGQSIAIQRLRRQVTLAANARGGVIIRGETGTGKNLMAQVIHRQSASEGPFIVFSCTSLPPEIIVRELAGFEGGKNGFGADGRPGKFELADGGTLFFQDIDALPLNAQSILLNVLELGIVQRLNSNRAIPVQVRVIASTAADMEALINQSSFRPDLYYHLGLFEIHLPPLRERMEDLPLLVENFLKRFSAQFNEPLEITAEAMACLYQYSWPGNLHELEAVLNRAASQLTNHESIAPEHLPAYIREPYRLNLDLSGIVSGSSLDEIEREALLQAAQVCQGNLTHMAESLKVSRTTLWRKLKENDIDVTQFRPKANGGKSPHYKHKAAAREPFPV